MKYDIIKTENYLLAIGNDRKRGWFYCLRTNTFFQDEGIDINCCNSDLPIDAHLPLNNSPVLEGVDLLPPLENEVDKLAEQEFPYLYQPMKGLDTTLLLREGFIEGYNKAKEKYKWTDEDVIKIVEKSRETGLTAEYLLLSLSQPKYPVAFEQGNEVNNKVYTSITRRNDGFTLWIGKYIY